MDDIKLIERVDFTSDELAERLRSVNLHITKACNYRCKFCYARFNQVHDRLPREQWIQIISMLSEAGTEKVTFVGGEPTLVPYLHELVIHAKKLGLTTMVVTNGTKITPEYLQRFQGCLDWVGVSIDSSIEAVSHELGRGDGTHVQQTMQVARALRKQNIALKINTVVTSKTWEEDMGPLLVKLAPARWKVFQMLPIAGENDDANDLAITKEQFWSFVNRHSHLNPVAESNDDMIESYVMVDPQGRFFSNSENKLTHVGPIIDLGVKQAFEKVNFSLEKLIARNGLYDWEVS